MPAKIRYVSWEERSWINRELQAFFGSYRLDETSGLYFDLETSEENQDLISRTFLRLPFALRNIALKLGLTVSSPQLGATKYGSMSAVYGAWDSRDPQRISPHLEMSRHSLTPQYVMPHLIHECSHLLWATQSRESREAFIREMVYLIDTNFVEVTGYAQSYFDEWQGLLIDKSTAGLMLRRERAKEKWAMEAFCESVAKICCPSYKSSENRFTGELLSLRRTLIASNFDFVLSERQKEAA